MTINVNSSENFGKLGLLGLATGVVVGFIYKKAFRGTAQLSVSSEQAAKIIQTSTMPSSLEKISQVIGKATVERRKKDYPKALEILKPILASSKISQEVRAWAYLEQGLSLKLQGHYELAHAAFDHAARLGDSDTTGMLLHSTLYEQSKVLACTGQIDKAIETIQKAISNVPENDKSALRKEQMRNRLGEYFTKKGDFETARDVLESVKKAQMGQYPSGNEELMITLVRQSEAYIGLKQLKQAKELIDQAMAMQQAINQRNGKTEMFPDIFVVNGRIAESSNSAEAINCYIEAYRINHKQRAEHPIIKDLEEKLVALGVDTSKLLL